MKTLTAEQVFEMLKRKPEVEPISEDKPDFTYAEPEPKVEPSAMPSGMGEL